jgi:alkanesulfonate monooxygenase SsuD/methylene tetrahydromethanopterin reductase-like flavin-dependent oxidoreductase (luciferase family)
MKVGIGLPSTIPGTPGALILDWARRADEGPFSNLSTLDRVVYPNYEPLVTLAAAAGATRRVRLMTSVLLAPVRNAALLAKQTASIDALSGGRLTLGLGVGGREDDFRAAEQGFRTRGRRFEAQLEALQRIWAGQPFAEGVGAIGPTPATRGGPEVLIGDYTPPALARAARWGNGYIAGGGAPQQARKGYDAVAAAWRAAGRQGTPRFVGAMYFGLGDQAQEKIARYIGHYYAFLGPHANAMAAAVPSTPEAVKAAMRAFKDVGADELTCWPCIAEIDQVDQLAQLIG